MNYEKPKVKWPEIIEKIESSGYKNSYVYSKVMLSRQYMYKMLNGVNYMPEIVKERFEELFNCTFERPAPEPENTTKVSTS